MKDEVETPLRSMSVKGEWGKQGNVRPPLVSLSRLALAAVADRARARLHPASRRQYDANIERTIKHLDSCQTRLAKVRDQSCGALPGRNPPLADAGR